MSLERNPDQARDLMGDVILRAYERFDKLNDHTKFKSFLFSIAVNVRRELYRKKLNNEKYLESISEQNTTPIYGEDTRVYEVIHNLSKEQAEVFILFEMSDISLKDISIMTNTNISTVKTRLSRARNNLRKMLTQEFKKHITTF